MVGIPFGAAASVEVVGALLIKARFEQAFKTGVRLLRRVVRLKNLHEVTANFKIRGEKRTEGPRKATRALGNDYSASLF